jgi:type 1 fimbria pilin
MKYGVKPVVIGTILLVAGPSGALAAPGSRQAQVLIHGDIVPVACVMGPDVSDKKVVNLDSWSEADFQKQGLLSIYKRLYLVAGSKREFAVTATGCSGAGPDEGHNLMLRVDADSPMRDFTDGLFGDSRLSNGTLAGVTLAAPRTPGGKAEVLRAGDEVVMYAFASGEGWNAADHSTVNFTTYMAASTAMPGTGHIEAPIFFTVDYK